MKRPQPRKPKFHQRWSCDSCGVQGIVPVSEHEDVWSVVQKLAAAHNKLSPKCPEDARGLRVHIYAGTATNTTTIPAPRRAQKRGSEHGKR